ncbi:MAG: hypothetical protein KDK70_12540, partial [Myxococcales bacterium]|nr:hypothetical protein [Myxococcales bacterium]
SVRPDDGKAADAKAAMPRVVGRLYRGKTSRLDDRTALFLGRMRDIATLRTAHLTRLDPDPRKAVTECAVSGTEALSAEHPKVARCLELMPIARAAYDVRPLPGIFKPPKEERPSDFVPTSLDDCVLDKGAGGLSKSWDCGSIMVAYNELGLHDTDDIEATLTSTLPGKYKGEVRWLEGTEIAFYSGVDRSQGSPSYVVHMLYADPSTTNQQVTCLSFTDELADGDHPTVKLCRALIGQARR